MAISFPRVLPIKYFPWIERNTGAAATTIQLTHIRDEGMFQIQDPTYLNHRVLVLDSEFDTLAEITGDDLDSQFIGVTNVLTYSVDYSEYAVAGDVVYIGIVDSNSNKFMQNFMPDGDFATSTNWTLSSEFLTISSNNLNWSITSAATNTATYNLPLQVGSSYEIVVDLTSKSVVVGVSARNGAANLGACSVGLNTFNFTATDNDFHLQFSSTGTGTAVVNSVTSKMDYEDVTPEWVSSPFCVRDIAEKTTLIYGCSANDYFGLFMADTGLLPQLRVRSELIDADSVQTIESAIDVSGGINNYYAQNTVAYECRIDWLPSYLVHFMRVVFLMDEPHLGDDTFSLMEQIEVIDQDGAIEIKAYRVMLTPKTGGVTFKRIVNDPSDSSCIIDPGAYTNAYFDEDYVQQGTQIPYYTQT